MAGKEWGNLPPQQWFEQRPWYFFDITSDNGELKPVEVNNPRKYYFDHRALGISFKYEDLTKKPLVLPGSIPPGPLNKPEPAILATITRTEHVSGMRPERFAMAPVSEKLNAPFANLKEPRKADGKPKRILMRINGVNLKSTNMTGFDVHITTNSTVIPKRTDASFVGAIALFRHDGGEHDAHKGVQGNVVVRTKSDTFDVTTALNAIGETDPSKLHVVIVPYSLGSTVDGQKAIIETNALTFDSIEFLAK